MVRKRGVGVYRRRMAWQMRDLERLTPNVAAALLAAASAAPARRAGPASAAGEPAAPPAAGEAPGARNANLAGARCSGGPTAPAPAAI